MRAKDSWKKKIHPAFLEICEIYRTSVKIQSESRRGRATAKAPELRAQVARLREELLSRYSELRPGSPSMHVVSASARFLSDRDIAIGSLEWVCWRRFGKPLLGLLAREEMGSLEDHEDVRRATDEFWHLINGYRIVPFKGNSTHTEIIELGFNLGLGKLSGEELADCFDEVCPCGKDHDADALKKRRAHVRKQLKAAHEDIMFRIPARQTFEAYGADGLTARPHWVTEGIRYIEISQNERPECWIYQNGAVLAVKTSQFWEPDGLSRLLEAFGAESPEKIFSMFLDAATRARA